jgi:hypothetical protein
MNLQKKTKKARKNVTQNLKLKFVMTSVSSCQHTFSNIASTMHCCQMSKSDADHVDFLIRTL